MRRARPAERGAKRESGGGILNARVRVHATTSRRGSTTMKAWRLDRLGGELRFEDVPTPEVRPGSILVRIEASTLMSYIKPYVEGRLPSYHVPEGGFTPGGNCVGVIEAVGKDVGVCRREDAWLSLRCFIRLRMFQT